MARPLGELSRSILSSLKFMAEVIDEYGRSPMGSKYQLARWVWNQTRPTGVPYDTRYRRAVWRLRKAGLIRLQHNRIELAPEAQAYLEPSETTINDVRLSRPATWDGLWRMVIWDIPERKRDVRNRFRQKLTELGFVRIQGSIWVTPWPCESELQLLRSGYGLSSENVLYVEARRIEGEARLRTHFHLEGAHDQSSTTEVPSAFLSRADAELIESYLNQA
ncbi:hypothetical protein HY375_00380 [Candidatus Berkelbacteria bacterium]|nr:hypothetical protein [Candidatus Berkelbacteria bacterium]